MQSHVFKIICLYLTAVGALPVPDSDSPVTCTEQINYDRLGGDYSNLYAGQWDTCMNACAADDKCATAQYDTGSGWCYLKDSVNEAVLHDGVNTYDCRLPKESTKTEDPVTPAPAPAPTRAVAGSQEVNGRTCTIKPSFDRSGGDYGNIYALDFQTCLNACAGDAQCVSAQWLVSNQNCYLKNAANEGHESESVDTVDCAAKEEETVVPPATEDDDDQVSNGGDNGVVDESNKD